MTESSHAWALQMLERHGIVTREAVLAESLSGGFSGIYGVLKTMEERGQVRRGYFVDGLGAAQFAVPGAVDRLREVRDAVDEDLHPADVPAATVLAATDPAQPFGGTLPWPETDSRPSRSAGCVVVVSQGRALAWFDPRGHHLVVFDDAHLDTTCDALVRLVKDGRRRALEVRRVNGAEPAAGSTVVEALERAGFARGYRGWSLRD